MSADPGKENFSVAIQELEDNCPKVVYVELLSNPITELRENATPPFLEQLKLFSEYFEYLLEEFKPESVTMERFQMRFRTMGATSEVVNIMIGICSQICLERKIPVKLVIAGEWKNHFNRVSNISLNDTYKLVKRLPPHVIDSALIGLYYCMKNKDFYVAENIENYCKSLKEKYDESVQKKKLQKINTP